VRSVEDKNRGCLTMEKIAQNNDRKMTPTII